MRVRSINELEGEFRGTTMSGGSFDYACYKAMQFADELRNKLQEQGKDPSGEGWPNPTWPTDVACKLAEIAAFADYVGALMKEAEWLYSGDTGEDTFMCRVHGLESTQRVWCDDSNAKALEIASLRRRSPLTQDAILDMAEGCTLEFHSLLAFARAVERAHGIGA